MPKNLAQIFHFDSFGKRQEKYDRLTNTEFTNVDWKKLEPKEPYYFFVPKDFSAEKEYNKGFGVSEIFIEKSSGIHTGKDHLVIDINKKELEKRILDVLEGDENEIRNKYNLIDTSGWTLDRFKTTDNNIKNYVKLNFRPFDNRWIIYENKALKRDRYNIMKHIFQKENLGLVTIRRSRSNKEWNFITSTKLMTTEPTTITSLDNNYFFPLYLYNQNKENLLDEKIVEKVPNLDGEIILKIEKKLGMSFVYSVDNNYSDIKGDYFSPENLFDYIYSVLHSKSYREKYKEFLKIDFPKVPFNVNKETFFKMVELGRELRSYHLLENEKLIPNNFITKYPIEGDNLVEKIKYEDGKVFINDEQYFEGVPENVWNFYIGGYQPAQKWLKDRKGKELVYEDILHYGKMIISLNETVRIMEEIEGVFKV